MKAGDKKKFTVRFPADYHQKNLADKDIEFETTCNTVQKVELPKLDDAFAQSVHKDYKTYADLEKALTQSVEDQKESREKQRFELEVLDAIIKGVEIEMPDVLIDAELHKMLHELEEDLTTQGAKLDDYLSTVVKKSKEDFLKDQKPHAIKRVSIGLALKKLKNLEEIKVTDTEIDTELEKLKKVYKENKEALKSFENHTARDNMHAMLSNRKVVEKILSYTKQK